jgi:RNA recognition motif-containing protein
VATVANSVVLRKTRGGRAQSLGCGVVEFHTSEDAQKAIDQLNDSVLEGRTIKCREDRTVDDNDETNDYRNTRHTSYVKKQPASVASRSSSVKK